MACHHQPYGEVPPGLACGQSPTKRMVLAPRPDKKIVAATNFLKSGLGVDVTKKIVAPLFF